MMCRSDKRIASDSLADFHAFRHINRPHLCIVPVYILPYPPRPSNTTTHTAFIEFPSGLLTLSIVRFAIFAVSSRAPSTPAGNSARVDKKSPLNSIVLEVPGFRARKVPSRVSVMSVTVALSPNAQNRGRIKMYQAALSRYVTAKRGSRPYGWWW